jgi:hypothetical protein
MDSKWLPESITFASISLIDNLEPGYLAPPVGLNLLMTSYRFDKDVAFLRATLPVISVLSVTVLPSTLSHYGPTALVESLRTEIK